MGIKIVTDGGAINWRDVRRVFYVGLLTWVIGVRLLNLDPFDDLFAGTFTLGTVLDGLSLYAVWLLVWHVLWPLRPKISA